MRSIRPLARTWHAATALVVLVGVVLQIWLLLTGGADANSGETGDALPLGVRFARLISFFTIDSNLFVLGASILLAIRPDRDGPLWRVLHLTTLLSIVVTGTVFGLVLAPGLQLRDEAVIVTNLFHLVSPAMFFLGWVLFAPRRRWSWRMAPLAFVLPASWLVLTFVRGAITGWYPYPFLDAGVLGLGPALVGAVLVLVYAAVLAVLVLLVDRWVPTLLPAEPRAAEPRAAAA